MAKPEYVKVWAECDERPSWFSLMEIATLQSSYKDNQLFIKREKTPPFKPQYFIRQVCTYLTKDRGADTLTEK